MLKKKPSVENSTSFQDDSNDLLDISIILKVIPEFSGKISDFHRFISCCDLMYDSIELNSQKDEFISVIKCVKLIGPAYDAVKYKNFKSWGYLKTELKTVFLGTRDAAQLHIEFCQIRQLNNTVQQFANTIESLLSELNDVSLSSECFQINSHILKLNNRTAIKAFENGLNYPLRDLIKACRFVELSKAISKALEEEQTLYFSNQNTTRNSRGTVKTCQICNKRGHIVKNCYSLNTPSTSYSQFQRSSTINQTPRPSTLSHQIPPRSIHNVTVCVYCKKRGHTIDQCYKKQSMDTKRNNRTSDSSSHKNNVVQKSMLGNSVRLDRQSQSHAVRVEDLQQ